MSDELTEKAVRIWLPYLRQRGVTLEESAGELVVDGPEAMLTEGRLRDLKEHKALILAIITGEPA